MSGWIKIHRQIQNHWLWEEKPFTKGQAWIDVLMMVNHEDKKVLLGNELIEVKRGSRVTSIRQLCERWGWSNTKVNNFLKLLQEENMLIVKSDTRKTTITVVNYNSYQGMKDSESDTETSVKHQENIRKATRKHTNKNDKNDKNDKEDIYILTEEEKQFLETLNQIDNYPLDRKKDLEMFKTLGERYPELNLIEAIEQWRIYKLDKPLTKKSNPRSQINTAFKKYIEWGKCLKKGDSNGANRKRDRENETEAERLERLAIEEGLIKPGEIEDIEVDF